jgi:hypothetical protein
MKGAMNGHCPITRQDTLTGKAILVALIVFAVLAPNATGATANIDGEGRASEGADILSGGAGAFDRAPYWDAGPVVVTLDDNANDGEAGEGDNVRSDVGDRAQIDRLDIVTAVERFF